MRTARTLPVVLLSVAILLPGWPASRASAPTKALRFGKLLGGAYETNTAEGATRGTWKVTRK